MKDTVELRKGAIAKWGLENRIVTDVNGSSVKKWKVEQFPADPRQVFLFVNYRQQTVHLGEPATLPTYQHKPGKDYVWVDLGRLPVYTPTEIEGPVHATEVSHVGQFGTLIHPRNNFRIAVRVLRYKNGRYKITPVHGSGTMTVNIDRVVDFYDA